MTEPAPRFSLLLNPFAVLGAAPRTPLQDLPALAQAAGTPDANAALRTLCVPRSRLPAELGFLPGAVDPAPVIDTLQHDGRPDLAALPPGAQANVLAHLCAAGRATPDDAAALVALQAGLADPAVLAAINADRAAAGFPLVQPPAFTEASAALADLHAGALLAACLAAADPAARLTALVRQAPQGAPAMVLRRAAAAWSRYAATAQAAAELHASTARAALMADRTEAAVAAFCQAMRDWAAVTAPQRLSDARAGLDHGPALRLLPGWRSAGTTIAAGGRPGLALPLARTLADIFADLPGEAVRLRDDAQSCAGLVEDQTLEAQLAPLRTLAAQLAAAPAELEAALARRPFGPRASGVAAELWRAFDAACAAAVQSDAPWTIVRSLAAAVGGPHRARTAAALMAGLTARAEQSGREALAARLAAEQRGMQRAAADALYQDRLKRQDKSCKRNRSSAGQVLSALRALKAVTDDPAERAALAAREPDLLRRVRVGWASAAALVVTLLAIVMSINRDNAFSADPPYAHRPPINLVMAALPPGTAASAPAPAPAFPSFPQPAPFPAMPEPVRPTMVTPMPAHLAFLPTTPLPEKQPRNTDRPYALAEIRWCVFNEMRLQTARDAAGTDALRAGVAALYEQWDRACGTYEGHKLDLERTIRERDRAAAQLHVDGLAILAGAAP